MATRRHTVRFWKWALLITVILVGTACEEKITGDFRPNQPPETSIFVESSDTLNFTPSTQTIFWDGLDADGFVTGFYYTFSENPSPDDWTFTTERSETFPLRLTGTDTVYSFTVKSVDNDGLEDPTPARQLFPILNSPPTLRWATGSAIPDTTFTVASFSWSASDPDGDNTLTAFEYAIDDTSNWVAIEGDRRSVIIGAAEGLTPGDHALFLRAVDIAGATSPVIRMPENPDAFWHVKEPAGRYLLIDDYLSESSNSGFPDRFYRTFMDSLLGAGGEQYSYWNIEEQFPSSLSQFTETLKLFDRVIWYTDLLSETDPHFVAAQVAIPEFRRQGGKLIYTVQFNSGFGGQGTPLDFSPVDSLGQNFNFILTDARYYPDSDFAATFPNLPPLPELAVSRIIVGMIALRPKANAIPMYRYENASGDDPLFILAGRNDNSGQVDFVFSGTPLHFLRGNGNVSRFFDIVLSDLFGL